MNDKIEEFLVRMFFISLILLVIVFAIMACYKKVKEENFTPNCKFSIGNDVIIKNKTFNNNATISNVYCDCSYEITYYSYVMRQRRKVQEYEIRKPLLGF